MAWNWSSDFTAEAGVDVTDHAGVLAMMYSALNERAYSAAMPAAGDDAMTLWRTLQSDVDSLATQFVRPGSWAGTAMIKNLRYSDALNSTVDRNFPYPNGWSRSFRRVIYTVSQPGTDGQRARFEAQPTSIQCYSVLSTDPLYHTLVSTPAGEWKYSGQIFDHVSGAWVVSSDQTTDADIVSDNGVLGQPGDFLTGQMLNDIRDGLDQCTTAVAAVELTSTPAIFGTYALHSNVTAGNGYGSFLVMGTGAYGESGDQSSPAAADANFSITSAYSAAPFSGTIAQPGSYVTTVYRASAISQPMSLENVPGTLNYQVVGWLVCARAEQYTPVGGSPLTSTFDAQGSAMLDGSWQSFGSATGTISLRYADGPMIPFTLVSPPPDWPAGTSDVMGWATACGAILINWAVSGGFKYVSGYAGT